MPSSAPDRGTLQRWTFLVLFGVIAYLFWRVAEPLWVPISLGALIAIGLHPLHKKLLARLKGKNKDAISAFVLTASCLLTLLAFAALFSIIVFRQLLGMLHGFSERIRKQSPEEFLGPHISGWLSQIGEDPKRLKEHVGSISTTLTSHIGASATHILAASFGVILVIIFTAITAYYLLRHGERFTSWFVMALPLPDGQVWELVRNFRDVARVMLLGTGVTALYQGVVGFLGFSITGVPHPIVWGAATGVASIIPAIGTTVVWVPIVIWLIAHNHVGMGVGLFLYGGFIIIGVADYVLRPRLLGSRVKMNDLIIFIALFGGIEAFGLLGTILGPIIAALLLSMIHIYLRDYRPRGVGPQEGSGPPPPPRTVRAVADG